MDTQEFNKIIVNLNVLSELKVDNKLTTQETFFNVDSSHEYLQPGLRWYHGNSRDESISKINLLILKAFKFYESKPVIISYLEKSLLGLENLKKTYNDCAKSQARINVIIDEINRFLNNSRNVKEHNMININDENSDFDE
jgi:hypothetical protein